MKKILISLTLLLTISIASTETTYTTTIKAQDISNLTNEKIIIREVRTSRTSPENREVREDRLLKVESIPSSRIARTSREVRKDRLVMHIEREARKIAYLNIKTNKHFASLK